MTTTVTTVTISTVTVMGVAAALGLITILTLVALLISKEIATVVPGERGLRWSKTLNIGVVPLVVAFGVIVAVKLAEVL